MSLENYLQTHLAGAEGGSRLFARCAQGQSDPTTRAALQEMLVEVVEERERLRVMLHDLGASENRLLGVASIVGERVGRLVPHGSLLHRTAMTDLTELEGLRTAVSGKLSGFDGMLAVAAEHDGLDAEVLTRLRDQAVGQLDRLTELHAEAATRALS
ncbi:hypothetical protein ACHAAC_08980 [Aeromicrobium sp. CF4.19]|uniref:hypothetical protein n=1 Tax=Aeromicrobium sp. CF4.19 TaxID=3373082 RepID=UPI003EE6A9C2